MWKKQIEILKHNTLTENIVFIGLVLYAIWLLYDWISTYWI